MAIPGFSIGVVVPNLPIPGQTFRNIAIPNFRPAIYALAIREPPPSNLVINDFIFPLSPEHMRKEYISLANIFDVHGTPQQNGVERIVDQYGVAPPIITLEGTTGWQFHGADGYLTSGVQAMQNLETFLLLYAKTVEEQMKVGIQDLVQLELYDYFKGEYWQIVPIGRYGVRQDNHRPLISSFFFRFAAVRALDGPPTGQIADAIELAFALTQSQAAQNLNLNLLEIATFYSAQTYLSFGTG